MGTKSNKCIILVGASFDTGNLGVNALAWSALKILRDEWPEAEIAVVGAGKKPKIARFQRDVSQEEIQIWPVRYCRNPFAANHILKLWVVVMFCRLFPFLQKSWNQDNTSLGALLRADMIADITGGDSFSDIYGIQRLIKRCSIKMLCQLTGKPFLLLPQTYGPFKSRLARILAGSILKHADAIYSRDQEGLEQIRQIMGKRKMRAIPELCPDVAFVLEAIRPEGVQIQLVERLKDEGRCLIGLNISGLLYRGGYTQDNMFGLVCNYRKLVVDIVSCFAKKENHYVLLIPHVIQNISGPGIESDIYACQEVWNALPRFEQKKTMVVNGCYDQNQIKYLIGLCDFFMGARMHSTIAALSQCVPAVGMAYSKKFVGVFQTAGVEDCVVDMRQWDEAKIIGQIAAISLNREKYRQRLAETIPSVKQRIHEIFSDLNIQ